MGLLDKFVQPTTFKVMVACRPHEPVTLNELHSLQGNLKDLNDENYSKLRNSILELGFSFPFFVWKDTDGTLYTADGHQRERVLQRMQEENVELPSTFPAFEVLAKDRIEAKKKLLALNSQFGRITEEGLNEFMNEEGFSVDAGEIEDYVSFYEFEQEYTDDTEGSKENESNSEQKKSKEVICPNCENKFTI